MLKTLLQMTRPVNIVIAVITLLVGYYLVGDILTATEAEGTPTVALVLQSLGFAFAIAFGNIQNDVLDYESDKRNRPERALPSGRISLAAAKRAWIILLILSIACGIANTVISVSGLWFEGFSALTPAFFFVVLALLLIAYNIKLKHIPLLKNMTVAFLCTTPLILVLFYPTGIAETDIEGMDFLGRLGFLYPAMLFAFLLTTAREIYKDLEDESGDLMAGIITFPIAAGAPTARRLAGAFIAFTWILLSLPVVQGYYPILFLIISLIVLTPTFAYILAQAGKRNYHRAQSLVKMAMFVGIIALVISTVV